MIPFVKTKSGLNVYVDGKMVPIGSDHINFKAINELCLDTDSTADQVRGLLDIVKAVEVQTYGKVTIEGDVLKYEGRQMHNALATRILMLVKENQPFESFIKFMENLVQNPSYRAVNELYGFLEACTLPITNDGCFMAYKKVRSDYGSIHANLDGTHLDNSIGKTVSMPRNYVDEDSNRTCSDGLHVCSFGYLKHFSSDDVTDRVLICKVNPKDVVAVPKDYDNQKMRVCEYVVVDEIPNDGITQLVDWCFGRRDVEFVREKTSQLQEIAKAFFDLKDAPKIEEDLYNHDVTEVMKYQFVAEVIETMGLGVEPEDFFDRYDELSVVNLLQFVSNWID